MECPKCQAENEEPRRFCRKCGTKLSVSCSGCCFENVHGDAYCGGCGRDLMKPMEETGAIDYEQPQSYTPKHIADKIITSRSSMEGERKIRNQTDGR